MELQITIEYLDRRCDDCGAFWAIETERQLIAWQCPLCANRAINKARTELEALTRSYSALQANFTRLKKSILILPFALFLFNCAAQPPALPVIPTNRPALTLHLVPPPTIAETLAWTNPVIVSNRILAGNSPGQYFTNWLVAVTNVFTVSNLNPRLPWYFGVKAVSADGQESACSREASFMQGSNPIIFLRSNLVFMSWHAVSNHSYNVSYGPSLTNIMDSWRPVSNFTGVAQVRTNAGSNGFFKIIAH